MFRKTKVRLPHVCLLTSVLAVAGAGMSAPAAALTPYDGDWSVVITTHGGACQPSFRSSVEISNGVVLAPAGGAADVHGRVNPRGAVQVSVRAGDEWAVGSGRLGRVSGGGVWRGQGSSGFCDGTWVAQRRGGAGEAEAAGGPVYNYAPGAGVQAPMAAGSSAACEARFRSYNPATGTYIGFDGLPHRCR